MITGMNNETQKPKKHLMRQTEHTASDIVQLNNGTTQTDVESTHLAH